VAATLRHLGTEPPQLRASLLPIGGTGATTGRQAAMDDGERREPLRVHGSQRALIRIAMMGNRGRGVVADAHIGRGQLVERSPVLIIPQADRAATDGTVVFTYVFMWEHGSVEEDLYQHQGRAAIALGFTSLLNRSTRPTASSSGTSTSSSLIWLHSATSKPGRSSRLTIR
jgi:hypothetical protein